MNFGNFNDYSTEEFVFDQEFRQVVKDSESERLLKDLMEKLPHKEKEIRAAAEIIKGLHPESILQAEKRKEELWQRIVQIQQRRMHIPGYLIRIAASLLIIVAIGSVIHYQIARNQKSDIIVSPEVSSDETRLVLGDGQTVSINSKQSTLQYNADGSGITVNDSSEIKQPVSEKILNEMIVPFGRRSSITLSEGTRVWLNSGSKLIFPPIFKGKTREVFLEGEAFFDVAENKEMPFWVKTDLFSTKVYGTRFNIQAYGFDKEYKIVLLEGKISMNSVDGPDSEELFLDPNQMASISKNTKTFEVRHVENAEAYTAWIDGYLTFANEAV